MESSNKDAEYGTTFRLPLKDGSGKWQVMYARDLGHPFDRLIAEEKDGYIIQIGINADSNDTTLWHWNSHHITKDTFHWEAIWSTDQGETWHLGCELDAVRRPVL